MNNSEYIFLVIFIALVVYLGIMIPFLLTQQNTLKAVSPENRRLAPGMVWLSLIPFLNYIWQFVVVVKVSESIDEELHQRGIQVGEAKPGFGIGIAYCVLVTLSIFPTFFKSLFSIAGLVCWIIYWVKIYGYKKRLKGLTPKGPAGMNDILDSGI
jgi:hypothetical protein